MSSVEDTIRRLLRPQSVVNWTRHNFRRIDKTEKGLIRFAKMPPKYSLGEVYSVCERIVVDRIPLKQAEACVERIKNPFARKSGEEIIPAFFSFARTENLDGLATFAGMSTPYPMGRGHDGSTLTIPVTPTFTILDGDAPTPVFLIGWATMIYDDYQKYLVSTIIRNALLTQQDFLKSDAKIICTPKFKRGGDARNVTSWSVRQYAILSDEELQTQFDRYGSALSGVIRTLRSE